MNQDEKIMGMLSVLDLYFERRQCFYCKHKFEAGLLNFKKQSHWNVEWLWHIKQTHGLEPIELLEIIQQTVPPKFSKFLAQYEEVMEKISI